MKFLGHRIYYTLFHLFFIFKFGHGNTKGRWSCEAFLNAAYNHATGTTVKIKKKSYTTLLQNILFLTTNSPLRESRACKTDTLTFSCKLRVWIRIQVLRYVCLSNQYRCTGRVNRLSNECNMIRTKQHAKVSDLQNLLH